MKKLLNKELKLTTIILTWLFLAFSLMTLIPNYPALIGGFFICYGMFLSVQIARENNDIVYSALLPVKKKDVVAAKYAVTCLFQLLGFILEVVFVIIKCTVLKDEEVYSGDAMMRANLFFLALLLIIFMFYNVIFLGGFFKTAYKYGVPLIIFAVVSFVIVILGEVLHHVPGLGFLNDIAGDRLYVRIIIFVICLIIYLAGTWLAMKKAQSNFEKIDL